MAQTENGIDAVTEFPGIQADAAFNIDASAALEASSVVVASKGTLYGLTGRIDSTAATDDYYLQVIKAGSVPGDGAVTLLVAPQKIAHTTGTNTLFTLDLGEFGAFSQDGIVWCISTTEFTKTIAGNVASITAFYKN